MEVTKDTFTEEDYSSNDGFNVNFWGKLMWTMLHTISFNYPVEPTEIDKDHYHDFLMSLKFTLPCKSCRENYAKNLEALDYSRDCLESRKTFSMFIYRLHNCVNKMLGKPCTLTYEQVRARYELFRARCVNSTPIVPKYKETGCTTPLNGIKSKSIIQVVPLESKNESFAIDPKCIPKRTS